ncbi:hypothetical protein GOODEAATRI_017596 [Goodea atripinnis]|uniref:Uncharacterized protein n=1 Tax=Goodea atripinnis TaxID=208336 RepID=A0ABV0P5N7_9TELE
MTRTASVDRQGHILGNESVIQKIQIKPLIKYNKYSKHFGKYNNIKNPTKQKQNNIEVIFLAITILRKQINQTCHKNMSNLSQTFKNKLKTQQREAVTHTHDNGPN